MPGLGQNAQFEQYPRKPATQSGLCGAFIRPQFMECFATLRHDKSRSVACPWRVEALTAARIASMGTKPWRAMDEYKFLQAICEDGRPHDERRDLVRVCPGILALSLTVAVDEAKRRVGH